MPDGDYYLGVVVDSGNEVTEFNEENNYALRAGKGFACNPTIL
jgi:subtilase family serine protease